MKRGQLTTTGHGDLEASFVLIFPLLLAYEIGVLFAGRVNGADVVTRAVYAIAPSRAAYLLIYACVAVLFLLWIRREGRYRTLRLEIAAPVILEAAIYALTLGALITVVLDRLLGLSLDGNSVVAALGAGVHEELVFRLGLFAGFVALLEGLERRFAITLALVTSSLLFAAAHHLGAHGEPFTMHAFAFRALAGAAFGAIFWFRSFAHAVYAHVLYDLVVAAS
ncbi:MAG TPA: CPBP family intramembrane glutamic endopeptidase [Kofleriaceae bacterium]|nr:CPBP family intramembrane glutamic endopeptidase [Kofleriaceae bacterium]